MRSRRTFVFLGAIAVAAIALSALKTRAQSVQIDPAKIVDLTHTFDASTIYWPGEETGFAHEYEKRGMLRNRHMKAIAIDTASMDPGTSKNFPVHQLWLGSNKPGFENLANADKLPPKGATIFCIPMKSERARAGHRESSQYFPKRLDWSLWLCESPPKLDIDLWRKAPKL